MIPSSTDVSVPFHGASDSIVFRALREHAVILMRASVLAFVWLSVLLCVCMRVCLCVHACLHELFCVFVCIIMLPPDWLSMFVRFHTSPCLYTGNFRDRYVL